MTKISRSFLFGVVAAAFAGPALAQGAITGLTGAMSEGGASSAAALGSMPRSDLKLNASASDLGLAANAVSASSSGGAIQGAGATGVSGAKLGAFTGKGAPMGASMGTSGTTDNVLANAMPSGNAFANALGAGGTTAEGGGAPVSGVNAIAALGVERSTLADALGGQAAIASQRIGR